MLRQLLHWKWVLTTLLVLAGVGVLIRLGIWQLDRLEMRRAFNARVLAQIHQPVLDLNQELPWDQLYDMEYRSVAVAGRYDFSQEVLLRNQVWEGQNGFHILTPLIFDDSQTAILVDRGWIPYEEGDRLAQFAEPGLVTVTGMIRRPQNRPDFGGVPDPTLQPGQTRLEAWNIVNLERIQAQVDTPLLPVYIVQAAHEAHAKMPYRQLIEPEISEGPHFGYALQWFAFASILGLGYPFFVHRQMMAHISGSNPDRLEDCV